MVVTVHLNEFNPKCVDLFPSVTLQALNVSLLILKLDLNLRYGTVWNVQIMIHCFLKFIRYFARNVPKQGNRSQCGIFLGEFITTSLPHALLAPPSPLQSPPRKSCLLSVYAFEMLWHGRWGRRTRIGREGS